MPVNDFVVSFGSNLASFNVGLKSELSKTYKIVDEFEKKLAKVGSGENAQGLISLLERVQAADGVLSGGGGGGGGNGGSNGAHGPIADIDISELRRATTAFSAEFGAILQRLAIDTDRAVTGAASARNAPHQPSAADVPQVAIDEAAFARVVQAIDRNVTATHRVELAIQRLVEQGKVPTSGTAHPEGHAAHADKQAKDTVEEMATTPRTADQWKALSEPYRKRLVTRGVTEDAYINGASLTAARGHAAVAAANGDATKPPTGTDTKAGAAAGGGNAAETLLRILAVLTSFHTTVRDRIGKQQRGPNRNARTQDALSGDNSEAGQTHARGKAPGEPQFTSPGAQQAYFEELARLRPELAGIANEEDKLAVAVKLVNSGLLSQREAVDLLGAAFGRTRAEASQVLSQARADTRIGGRTDALAAAEEQRQRELNNAGPAAPGAQPFVGPLPRTGAEFRRMQVEQAKNAKQAAAETERQARATREQTRVQDAYDAVLKRVNDDTRAAIAGLRQLAEAGASSEQVGRAQAEVYAKVNAELEAQGVKAPQRRQAVASVFAGAGAGVSGAELNQVRSAANALPPIKPAAGQGAEAAAREEGSAVGQQMGENARSTFANVFGDKGFYGRVVSSVGTFLVRNFSAGLVFGLSTALRDAIEQGLATESTFVRVSEALKDTGRSVGGLRTDLSDLSQQYGTSLKDVYETAAGLAGLFDATDTNNQKLLDTTKVALQLELISGGALNATEAMKSLASATTAFGDVSVQHIADVATVLQNRLGVNIEDTIEGVARLAGQASLLGLSFEETATYVATISKLTGQTGAGAGEQLSRILESLTTGRTQGIIQRALINPGGNPDSKNAVDLSSAFNTRDYSTILTQVTKHYADLSKAQQNAVAAALGGARQAGSVSAALHQGALVAQTTAATLNANGAAAERAAKISEVLNAQLKRLRTSFVSFFEVLIRSGALDAFGAGMKVILYVLEKVNHELNRLNDLTDKVPLLHDLQHLAALVAGLAVSFKLASAAASGLMGALGLSRGVAIKVAAEGAGVTALAAGGGTLAAGAAGGAGGAGLVEGGAVAAGAGAAGAGAAGGGGAIGRIFRGIAMGIAGAIGFVFKGSQAALNPKRYTDRFAEARAARAAQEAEALRSAQAARAASAASALPLIGVPPPEPDLSAAQRQAEKQAAARAAEQQRIVEQRLAQRAGLAEGAGMLPIVLAGATPNVYSSRSAAALGRTRNFGNVDENGVGTGRLQRFYQRRAYNVLNTAGRLNEGANSLSASAAARVAAEDAGKGARALAAAENALAAGARAGTVALGKMADGLAFAAANAGKLTLGLLAIAALAFIGIEGGKSRSEDNKYANDAYDQTFGKRSKKEDDSNSKQAQTVFEAGLAKAADENSGFSGFGRKFSGAFHDATNTFTDSVSSLFTGPGGQSGNPFTDMGKRRQARLERDVGIVPGKESGKYTGDVRRLYGRFEVFNKDPKKLSPKAVKDAVDKDQKELQVRLQEIRDSNLSGPQKDALLSSYAQLEDGLKETSEHWGLIADGIKKADGVTSDQIASIGQVVTALSSLTNGSLKDYSKVINTFIDQLGFGKDSTILADLAVLSSPTRSSTVPIAGQEAPRSAAEASQVPQSRTVTRAATVTDTQRAALKTLRDMIARANAHIAAEQSTDPDKADKDTQATMALVAQADQAEQAILQATVNRTQAIIDGLIRRGDFSSALAHGKELISAIRRVGRAQKLSPEEIAAQVSQAQDNLNNVAVTGATRGDRINARNTRNPISLAQIDLDRANRTVNTLRRRHASDDAIQNALDQQTQAAHTLADAQNAYQLSALSTSLDIATAPADAIGQARNAITIAATQMSQARTTFGEDSQQYQDALRAYTDAQRAFDQAVYDDANAANELVTALANARGDTIGAALDTLHGAQQKLQQALARSGGANTAEVKRARAQVATDQASYLDAIAAHEQAAASLAEAIATAGGFTVRAANIALRSANQQLANALKKSGGADTDAVRGARATVAQAQAAARDAKLNDELDTINFNKQMGRISSSTAIAQLRHILATENLTKQERRNILLQIHGLQQDLVNSLTSSGFNIGNIALPTPYQVRRSLGIDKVQTIVKESINDLTNVSRRSLTNRATTTGSPAVHQDKLVRAMNEVRDAVHTRGATHVNVDQANHFNVPTAHVAHQIASQVIALINQQNGQQVRANTSTPRLVNSR